jgi:threonine dehydrogenase-like Zn-dependent dehydrogenase
MAVEEVAEPVAGPTDVVVRVLACGLCGSDRHMFRGEYPTAKPVTLGHEFAGEVVAVGAEIVGIAPGQLVTGDPNVFCGVCPQCRRGRFNLCERLRPIGVWRDGGFADYVLVPASHAIALPAGTDPVHGAFCEPLACCLHGLDVARIRPGDSVAILGGGVIGLIMVQLARLAGAAQVVLSTRQAARRDLALAIGATAVIDPGAGDVATTLAGPDGLLPGGADVVLECAGVPDTVREALAVARRGGAVVLFGVTPQGVEVPVSPFDLLFNELRLEAAYLNPSTHARAAAMVAAGTLELDRLVTRTIGLEALPAALAAPPGPGEVKTIIVP